MLSFLSSSRFRVGVGHGNASASPSVRWSDGQFITAITSVLLGLFQGLDFVVEIIQIEREKRPRRH